MGKFQHHLKIYKWWNCQVPLMCIAVYYQLIRSNPMPNLGKALITMGLYLVTTIGIAGYGQLMNDLCDREQDRRTGAHNLMSGKNGKQIAIQFFGILMIAGLPWLWLPSSPPIFALVGLELVLLTLYSVPPFRLKNRGVLGVLADASYAYSIPILVSTLVFGRIGNVPVPPVLFCVLFAWSFCEGLYSILNHQLQDEERDRMDNIKTFVTRFGWERAFRIMSRVLLPLELICFLMLLVYMVGRAPLVPIGYVLFVAWMFYRRHNFAIWQTAQFRRMPELDRVFFVNAILLFRFYIEWCPLLLLLTLVWHSPIYILWLFLHLYLFKNGVTALLTWDLPEMYRMRRLM